MGTERVLARCVSLTPSGPPCALGGILPVPSVWVPPPFSRGSWQRPPPCAPVAPRNPPLAPSQISTDKLKGHGAGVLCLDGWKGVGRVASKSPLILLSGDSAGGLIAWDGRKRKSLHSLPGHTDGAQRGPPRPLLHAVPWGGGSLVWRWRRRVHVCKCACVGFIFWGVIGIVCPMPCQLHARVLPPAHCLPTLARVQPCNA